MEYVDSDECEQAFVDCMPPVLLVCDTLTLQRRVQRYLDRMCDEAEQKILVTNQALLHEANKNDAIWTAVGEEENRAINLC